MSSPRFVNSILNTAMEKMAEELTMLVGQEVSFSDTSARFVGKEEFLDMLPGRSVLTTMELSGDHTGAAYLVVSLSDAIVMGGGLILLPQDEIEDRQKKNLFDGEVSDAFGEIGNIVAGAYTDLFDEKLTYTLHAKKTVLEAFIPGEIDPDSDQLFPTSYYYMSESALALDGEAKGMFRVIFPPAPLGLEPPEAKKEEGAEKEGEGGPEKEPEIFTTGTVTNTVAPAIVVTCDTLDQAKDFANPLNDHESQVLCISVQDDLNSALRGKKLKGVFLVMSEVGDRGLASIIKVQAAVGQLIPIVVAGPAWTRKHVLQAVKYGATDILVTPATDEELLEKTSAHMKSME